MSSRLSTSRLSRSSDSSTVASSSSRSCAVNRDAGRAQAADGRLRGGERRAQVVADRREQGGAHPVHLGQWPGGRGLGAEAFLAQGDDGLGGEGLDDPPVGGGQRVTRAAPGRSGRR